MVLFVQMHTLRLALPYVPAVRIQASDNLSTSELSENSSWESSDTLSEGVTGGYLGGQGLCNVVRGWLLIKWGCVSVFLTRFYWLTLLGTCRIPFFVIRTQNHLQHFGRSTIPNHQFSNKKPYSGGTFVEYQCLSAIGGKHSLRDPGCTWSVDQSNN